MARSFADVTGEIADRSFKQRQLRMQNQNDELDRATKMASLQESGYTIKEQPRSFFGGGGMTLERDPNFESAQVPGYRKLGGKYVEDKEYVSPLDQAKIDAYKSKMGAQNNLTPGQKVAKDKATNAIFSTVEGNVPKRRSLAQAQETLPKIPQGFGGKIKIGLMKNFDPQNPILGDWQNLKSVLTDSQFLKSAMLKGAISDFEQKSLADAAANDDLISISRMGTALKKLGEYMDAEESALKGAYKQNYGEDPSNWFQPSQSQSTPSTSNPSIPSWVPENFDYAGAKAKGVSDEYIKDWIQKNLNA